jgi:hypothetical protein
MITAAIMKNKAAIRAPTVGPGRCGPPRTPPSPAGLSSSCRARQFDPGLGRVRAIGLFSFSVPPIDHIAELLCHATRCEAAADKLPGNVGKGLQIIRCDLRSNTPPKPAPAPIAACCPAARAVFCGPAPKTFATCAGRKPARAAPKGASIAPALPHLFGNALSSAFCGRQSSGANAKLAQQSIDRLRTADRVFDIRYLGTMPDGLAGCIDRARA